MSNVFRLVRRMVFGVTTFFAVIVIILAGLVINYTDTFLGGVSSFEPLGLAIGILTVLTLPIMLVISLIRKNAVTSMIVVELVWTFVLWVLWLAVGATAASVTVLIGPCSRYRFFASIVQAACNESTAITAFGFLNWIFLMFYNIFLLVMTIRQHSRGYTDIWTKDVTETDLDTQGDKNTQVVYDPQVTPTYVTQYPPQQVGTPVSVVPPQTTGSYTPQVASPYPQPQVAVTQPQTATSPYPQV